jgi:hypothetical protein
MSHHFCLLPLCLALHTAVAQPGCPDPQATNYDASATSNNGSCLYPLTAYLPVWQASLPDNLMEISGHVKAGAYWYAHNDGSDGSRFYRFNPENGSVNQEISLKNASNKDWEDVAASSTHLYLGDFGNNLNDRQDLGIYRIPLNKIGNDDTESIDDDEWNFIPFAYADQTDFSTQPQDSTVFDCESIIFWNNKIHLFTKNRKDYITSHYIVNQVSGKAEKVESFDTQGLITGADISPDGKLIALSGYDLRGLPKTFVWLLWDWQAGSDAFFSGNKRRLEFGSALTVGQVEGIGFSGNRTGYITNERTIANGITFVNESVRTFDFGAYVPQSTGVSNNEAANGLRIMPNPFSQNIYIQFLTKDKPDFLQIVDASGQVVRYWHGDIPDSADLGALPGAVYACVAGWKNKTLVHRIMKQ